MKFTSIVLAGAVWGSVFIHGASAQPILNRVEQFVRDQIDSVRSATQPGQPPQTAEPGYLGLTADDTQDNGRAVRVDEVVPGGPAAKAGLLKGDILTSIGGQPIRTMDDMGRALQNQTAGTRLIFGFKRGTANRQEEVTLGRRPPVQPSGAATEELPTPTRQPGIFAGPDQPGGPTLAQGPRLGIRTVNVTDAARRQNNLPDMNGALVSSMGGDSPAARAGIPIGAVIVAFDGKPVNSPQDLANAVRTAGARDAEVMYVHGGQATHKTVSLGSPAPSVAAKIETRDRPIEPPVKPRPSDEDEGPVLGPATAAPADARTAALEARIRELEERIAKLEAERKAEREVAK